MRSLRGLARASLLVAPLCLAVLSGASFSPARAEILDNSFFIEEAYNQEQGIVQHIQTMHWSWERDGDSTLGSFSYALTQEWPLSGQRHQISYTIPYDRAFGDRARVSGVGDVQFHYRYQALMESPTLPAFAPRLSLLIPTGDADRGLGAGTLGFQANLPFSKALQPIHLHANVGATFVPNARITLPSGASSARHDLFATNLGFSVIWALRDRFHLMFEFLTEVEESIDESGREVESSRVLVSPGARFAIDRKDGGQWVFGAAGPVGANEGQDDAGLLLYLSFEHPF